MTTRTKKAEGHSKAEADFQQLAEMLPRLIKLIGDYEHLARKNQGLAEAADASRNDSERMMHAVYSSKAFVYSQVARGLRQIVGVGGNQEAS